MAVQEDIISVDTAKHLPGLFQERVRRSPAALAYKYFEEDSQQWLEFTWQEMAEQISRWRTALANEGLNPGDRVAIMLRNWPFWVMFEQAALSLGLVLVPLYTNDRPANIGYILENAGIQLILIHDEQNWDILSEIYKHLEGLKTILTLKAVSKAHDVRIKSVDEWLPTKGSDEISNLDIDSHSLATIVYTSGTTGNPKGVMLSHHNILWNASSSAACDKFYPTDIFLSFLPLSHMFERTVGYYMAMLSGATVVYARSIEQLAEDFMIVRPTVLVTVPRIFERVYNKVATQLAAKPPVAAKLFNAAVDVGWHRFLYQQGRVGWSAKLLFWPVLNKLVASKIVSKLGGRMRLAISGGAPLSPEIARTFIGLGLTISQGYGMTELSPVVSTNRLIDNKPETVGQPLNGVEVKLGTGNELLIRSPGVMLGYWGNLDATKETIDEDGWLHTGDVARLDGEHIQITGRLKEIIVLANGEKIPPADMELAIATDPMFEQVMIIGEGKPFLSALVVLNRENWKHLADQFGLSANDEDSLLDERIQKEFLDRIKEKLGHFPGYAKVFRLVPTLEPWTVEAGLITPTLKLKRNSLVERYEDAIVEMYSGH